MRVSYNCGDIVFAADYHDKVCRWIAQLEQRIAKLELQNARLTDFISQNLSVHSQHSEMATHYINVQQNLNELCKLKSYMVLI